MISRLLTTLFAADDRTALKGFHRAELRDAGVTDFAFDDFLAGR
ncbi:MAG: hypothetical protein ACFBRM_09175 [Pikeienuella sp.]